MRIGIDIECLAGGRGPARYTEEIIKAISAVCSHDDRFFLYNMYKKNIDGLPDNFVFRHLPMQKRRPWLNWILPRAVKQDNLDVMFFPANDFWLWRVVPTVITLHDIAPVTHLSSYFPFWRDHLQNKLQMMFLARIACRVVTISEFSAKIISSSLPHIGQKLVVIYNGLSDNFHLPARGGTYAEPYILFVGGFDRRKNLERLIEAYKLLLSRGRKEKLILAGSAGMNQKLYYDMPALVGILGLKGQIEIKSGLDDAQLSSLYAGARLFILPSLMEGFGLPVIEAMACGCPVVASNAASLPEVGGNAACYFNPYDVQEMACCMESVLSDANLRREMIRKGFEQVKKFSWHGAGQSIYKIFRDIVRDV